MIIDIKRDWLIVSDITEYASNQTVKDLVMVWLALCEKLLKYLDYPGC